MFSRDSIAEGSGHLTDESKMTGQADHVICPFDESEVREILRFANARGLKVTVGGRRTGLCGGSVPQGGDVVSMENITGPIGIGRDAEGYFIRVQANTTPAEINDILIRRDYSGLRDVTPDAVASLKAEPTPYFYPVDPTEMNSSIGGNIATNASGPRTFRYGPTRDWVRRIRVTLPEASTIEVVRGETFAEGRRLSFPAGRNYYSFDLPGYDFNSNVKNSAGPMSRDGMDMIDLFIGSEGIFGIVTEADLRLVPWHPLVSMTAFFPDDASALAAVPEVIALEPEFLEYMDGRSLDLIRQVTAEDPALVRVPRLPEGAGAALFLDIPEDAFPEASARMAGILESHGSSAGSCWCGREDTDRARMRDLRHCVPKSINARLASLKKEMPWIHKVGSDISVPADKAEEMAAFYRERLEAEGLDYVVFGHIADSHLHVNIIPRSEEEFGRAKELNAEFAAKAVELGGSPSAEHGIGKIKTRYIEMMYGKEGAADIARVKSVLDPNGVLNIGNITGGLR